MPARTLGRKAMLAVGLSVAVGAVGMGGATASAQAIPDCTWIDCPPPREPIPLKIKWPPPVCLSCPDDFRGVFDAYIRTDFEQLIGLGVSPVQAELGAVRPDQVAAFQP